MFGKSAAIISGSHFVSPALAHSCSHLIKKIMQPFASKSMKLPLSFSSAHSYQNNEILIMLAWASRLPTYSSLKDVAI